MKTFSLLLGIYLGVELLDHMISPYLTFRETVFHSGCSIQHSQQQCVKVPISPNPYQRLLLSIFLTIAVMVGVKWYLTVVSICISLMFSDIEHFFHVLIGHLYISFGEMSIHVLCPCLNWVVWFFCCWVLRVLYIFWILIPCQIMICKYFLSFCGLPLTFLSIFNFIVPLKVSFTY